VACLGPRRGRRREQATIRIVDTSIGKKAYKALVTRLTKGGVRYSIPMLFACLVVLKRSFTRL
jgi:hypothetical protein